MNTLVFFKKFVCLFAVLLHGDVEEFLLVVVFTAKGTTAHAQSPIPKLQILSFFKKFVCLF